MNNTLNDKLAGDLSTSLRDLKFPAVKDDLLKEAKIRNASQNVIDAINDMSASKFYSIADVMNDYDND